MKEIKMKKRSILAMAAMLLTVGCSTIVNGTTQEISVVTSSTGSASCDLRDNTASYKVIAPGRVTVKRGDGPLFITCKNEVGSGEIRIEEEIDSTVVWGGHAGFVVDSISGAYQHYPSQIVVPMGR